MFQCFTSPLNLGDVSSPRDFCFGDVKQMPCKMPHFPRRHPSERGDGAGCGEILGSSLWLDELDELFSAGRWPWDSPPGRR